MAATKARRKAAAGDAAEKKKRDPRLPCLPPGLPRPWETLTQVSVPVKGPGSMPELATGELLAATSKLFALGIRHGDALFVAAARLVESLRYATEATENRKALAAKLAKMAGEVSTGLDRELLTPPLRDHRVFVREHVLAMIADTMHNQRARGAVHPSAIATVAALNGAAFAMGLDEHDFDLDGAIAAVNTALLNPAATPRDVLDEIAREHGARGGLWADEARTKRRKKQARRARTTH